MSERVATKPPQSLSRPNATTASSGLLQRKCACGSGGSAGLTGSCDDCSRKRLLGLQTKLEVSQPGDSFEQEADRVADEVVRQPAPAPSQNMSAPGVGVQRKTITPLGSSASAAGAVSAPPVVQDALNSPGQPLDSSTRSFMESRFGHDFGRVRVHTDALAQRSAQAVDSLAYTVGHNVVFAAGQYAPRTDAGRRLLAHELTHVLQQSGTRPGGAVDHATGGTMQRQAAGGVLQRQPAPVNRKVRILSLDEIKADPKRREALKLSGLSEAKVCRDISVPFTNQKCPTALKPNTEVTIVGSAAGGAWLKLACAGIPGFGDKEQCFVPNVFAKDVPVVVAEKPKPAPVAAERPKEEPAAAAAAAVVAEPKEETLSQRALKRLAGLPEKTKWNGTKGRAFVAINYAIVAKDFWFNEPTDQDAAATIVRNVKKNFSDVYLTDSNFDKRFGDMNGFTRTQMRNFLLAGRGAFERLRTLTIPGLAQSDATWDQEIKRLKASHEVLEVLSGDIEAKESKNIKALDDATSLKPATAFVDGLLEGFKSELSEEDYKVLAAKLAGSQVVTYFAPPIIVSGAAVGIAKDIGEAFKGFADMIEKPAEMAENMAQLLSTLMFDEEGARVMGQAMGAEHGKEIHKLAGENLVKFTYKLGELIGPTVVYTVLSIVSGGAIGGAAVSARLSKFLVKFPKAAKIIDRIKGLMPKGRAAKAAEKAAEGAGDAKAAAGKARALRGDAPDAPDKPRVPDGSKVPDKPDAPDKPKAPDSAAKAGDADGGATRKPDGDKDAAGQTPPGKKVIAEEAADGHTYKILEDGTIIRCSDCGPLRHRIEDFSEAHPKAKGLAELQKELAEIEAITDPKVKARRAAQLDKKLKATMSQHKPGAWQDDFSVNNMSKDAAAYQSRVTGAKPGKGYYVNDVQFDGFDKGKLIDAKYFTNDGRFMRDTWYQFNKAWSILDDAKRQLKAAGGMPIEWRVAGKEPAKLIRQLFATHDIPIKVVYWP